VVLMLPLDVQAATAPPLAAELPSFPRIRPVRPGVDAIAEATDALMRARRPLVIAGRGAVLAGAGDDLRRLAERLGALLATSAVANGLFAGDPWSLGISGGFASPLAAELISGADLLVGWGCALNQWTTRHGRLIAADAVRVQVDVEHAAIGAHRPVDLGVVGDVAATARAVLARGVTYGAGYRSDALRERIAARSRWRDEPYVDLSGADRIDARTLNARLDDLLPAERIVAVDSGNFMGYPSAYLQVPDEFGFCFTQAFQSIGLGLATAIGAALARPDRLPVAALGDGGFLMGISELETAARLGLPLLIVVHNDAAYGAEVHHFGADADLRTVRFPDSDLAAIARGHGIGAVTVRRSADLDAVTAWLDGPRQGPFLVDAKIVSDGGSWWLAEAFRAH
jgi:thiamine pyrophosphate-dependent acetolactate synthase large subunit-like protein